MKRGLILCLIFCLFSCGAAADAGKPLYAVKDENGLWGYIDSRGTLVIPGTFSWAEDFRGDYALACQYPEGYALPRNRETGLLPLGEGRWMQPWGLNGIINTQGEWVVPPEYFDILSNDEGSCYAGGLDTGVYWLSDGPKEGFFDIPSGFFSGLIYDGVCVSFYEEMDARLIGVIMDGKLGFASRETGEIVIPCRYDPEKRSNFSGDYALVMPLDSEISNGWILIDRTGRDVPLPPNCYAIGSFHDGLAPVRDIETDLCGFVDAQGRPVIAPQYAWAYGFSQGLACVRLMDGGWAMITPENEIAFLRPDEADAHFSSVRFSHGLIRCGVPEEDTVVFLNTKGEEAFRLTIEGLTDVGDFKENGVAFYAVHSQRLLTNDGGNGYGVGLLNDQGEILTPPVFYVPDEDWWREYSEGLLCITETASLKEGYIDERGQWAFPPVQGYCLDFRDSLAQIILYPDVIFVDREGNEVYRFTN